MPTLISQSRFGPCLFVSIFTVGQHCVIHVSLNERGGGEVQPALAALALATTVNHQTGLGKIKWDSQSVRQSVVT